MYRLYLEQNFEPEITINLEFNIGQFCKNMGSSKSFTEKKVGNSFERYIAYTPRYSPSNNLSYES